MTTRSWHTLTGSAVAFAALMLFAAPATAQYYGGYNEYPSYGYPVRDYPYTSPYPTGGVGGEYDYGRDLESYYDELEERADYYEDRSDYYENDGWFDWF